MYDTTSWLAARRRAEEALDGAVFKPVGTATHYHTNWVYPYWSPSLVKVAQVDTHLFFRWPGTWGDSAALAAHYHGNEPAIRALVMRPAHGAALADLVATPTAKDSGEQFASGSASPDLVVRNADGGGFIRVNKAWSPADAVAIARTVCGNRIGCKVMGWSNVEDIPAGYPVTLQARAALLFSYVRDERNIEIAFYDCKFFSGVKVDECMPKAWLPSVKLRKLAPSQASAG